MHLQRLLTLFAVAGFVDLCLAACHCTSAAMAKEVASACVNRCRSDFANSPAAAKMCPAQCESWEQSHNCVPRKKRSIELSERDELANLAEDLVERNETADTDEHLIELDPETALLDERGEEATESPDAKLDLAACLGNCQQAHNLANMCVNTRASLILHAA